MAEGLNTTWIILQGAPDTFESDAELQWHPIKSFVSAHRITLRERSFRRKNKTGVVERKNATVKRILEWLQNDDTTASDATLLARATFISSVFYGSKVLGSFELAKGYTPEILGRPRNVVSERLLESYREQFATRALQRLISSRAPSTI